MIVLLGTRFLYYWDCAFYKEKILNIKDALILVQSPVEQDYPEIHFSLRDCRNSLKIPYNKKGTNIFVFFI